MHKAFFGDAEYSFALTYQTIVALEDRLGASFGEIYQRTRLTDFRFNYLIETVRFGLIGGGTSPEKANDLIEIYGKSRPVMELLPLAFEIIDRAWNGEPSADAEGNPA